MQALYGVPVEWVSLASGGVTTAAILSSLDSLLSPRELCELNVEPPPLETLLVLSVCPHEARVATRVSGGGRVAAAGPHATSVRRGAADGSASSGAGSRRCRHETVTRRYDGVI